MATQQSRGRRRHAKHTGYGKYEQSKIGHSMFSNRNTFHFFASVQFSSVFQPCPTLCDPMDCSTPGFPVHHQFPEFTPTHVHQVSDAIQPSQLLSFPFSSHLQSFPASGSFPVSQFFASGAQSIGASASASVVPMNIQD